MNKIYPASLLNKEIPIRDESGEIVGCAKMENQVLVGTIKPNPKLTTFLHGQLSKTPPSFALRGLVTEDGIKPLSFDLVEKIV